MAFTHFAFPQHILKIVVSLLNGFLRLSFPCFFCIQITSEYTLDSHHIMWCRMFGCLSLLPALCSLFARHLPPHVQTHYLASRLIVSTLYRSIPFVGDTLHFSNQTVKDLIWCQNYPSPRKRWNGGFRPKCWCSFWMYSVIGRCQSIRPTTSPDSWYPDSTCRSFFPHSTVLLHSIRLDLPFSYN